MRLFKWLTTSATGLMLVSCVTINIYFPAAAAEKAADRIIGDVWGPATQLTPADKPAEQLTPVDKPAEQPTPADQSSRASVSNLAMRTLNWLVSPALAAPNLNINSSAINALRSLMKKRHGQLKPFYNKGAVGFTANGLIKVRDPKAISLKDRNKVNGLVADENKDRKALYGEIARANGHPEWLKDIQNTFARRWVSNAAKGWWYQKNGNWQQK